MSTSRGPPAGNRRRVEDIGDLNRCQFYVEFQPAVPRESNSLQSHFRTSLAFRLSVLNSSPSSPSSGASGCSTGLKHACLSNRAGIMSWLRVQVDMEMPKCGVHFQGPRVSFKRTPGCFKKTPGLVLKSPGVHSKGPRGP